MSRDLSSCSVDYYMNCRSFEYGLKVGGVQSGFLLSDTGIDKNFRDYSLVSFDTNSICSLF